MALEPEDEFSFAPTIQAQEFPPTQHVNNDELDFLPVGGILFSPLESDAEGDLAR